MIWPDSDDITPAAISGVMAAGVNFLRTLCGLDTDGESITPDQTHDRG
jgi:hypothetical protein